MLSDPSGFSENPGGLKAVTKDFQTEPGGLLIHPEEVASVTKEVVDSRPVVIMYTTDPCKYCDLAKASFLKDAKTLPYQVKIIDLSGDPQNPINNLGFPAFEWTIGSTKWRSTGWVNIETFNYYYTNTQAKSSSVVKKSPIRDLSKIPSFDNYQAVYDWPGMTEQSLTQHLQTELVQVRRRLVQSGHGLPDVSFLTFNQKKALHDALHSGMTLDQIKKKYGIEW